MDENYKPHYIMPLEIPDGEYFGLWGGYLLTFEYDGKTIQQATKRGIRSMNVRTKFRYVNGKLDQDSVKVMNDTLEN